MFRCVNRMTLFFSLLLAAMGAASRVGAKPAPPPPSLSWSFDIHNDRDSIPRGQVFLRMNGRRILVLPKVSMQFSSVPRSEYNERNVPATALTACSGWWAGAGIGLYVIQRKGRLLIFQRDEDEQSGDSAYRLIKSIPIAPR